MSFLAPWFLLFGVAAVVPLLIHLLRRRVGMEVEFPAARYLARAEREHSRTLRMRNLLLMLLRMLAIVLLAAAAARPAARWGGGGSGHAPTALAIVFDNSMSATLVQDGVPLIEQFRRIARSALAAASPDDRLWVITADGALRGGSAATLAEEIDRVRPLAGAGDLRGAVSRAVATVQASGLSGRQVAVLTDGQRTAWPSATQVQADVPVLVYVPAKAAGMNRAVAAADARPVRWTPRGAVATRVLTTDSTTYRMTLGERTLARGTVSAGEESVIRAAPAERGWTAGTIEIEPDELPADNVRHFALWIGPPPAVRVNGSAGPFAASAVDVLRASQRVVNGSAIELTSADAAAALPALLLAPADPVRVGAANRTLDRLGVPWRFGAIRRESAVVRGAQFENVTVIWRYQLVPRGGTPAADTLAVVGSEPWIVAGPGFVLVASPLLPEATTLPVSAAFLPWLGDVLSARLHADPGTVREVAPAARVTRPAGVEALESADGARQAIAGSSFTAPAAAGTYFFIQGARRVGALVVNPEPAESRLERWSVEELRQRVVSSGARVVTDDTEWARGVFSGVSRRSLVAPLLFALLLVLAAEMALVARGVRRQA